MDARGLRQQVLVQEGKRRMEMEKLSLIDVSSEDDSLISSPSSGFVFSVPFGRSDNSDEASCFSPLNPKESNTEASGQSPICWASSESTKTQKLSRYNLRQSLAWDSAFFTNEGVLNCEELSFVNTTFKRSELHLAEIQEEDQRPSESSIATESDSCALKNLEVDLFEQMRTSKETHGDGITQDSDVPSTLNVRTSCPIKETNVFELETKVELDANTEVKKLPSLRARAVPKQKADKCSKEIVTTCLAKPANSCGEENKSATKSAKVLAKGSNPPALTPSNKKSVVPSKTLKKDAQKVFPGKEMKVPTHVFGSRDSHSVTPVAKRSPRPSLESPRSGKTLPSRSASSLEGSTSISSNSSVDMPLKGARTKSESKNAALSAYIRSHAKLSPSVSPVSSIDCMSSDSSSSTCTYGISQKWKGVVGVSAPSANSTSGTKIPKLSVSQKYRGDLDSPGNISLSSANGSSPSASRKHANFSSNQRSHSLVGCTKPSGLRRPSPKIGFFDVANSPQGQNMSMLSGSLVAHTSCKNVDNKSGFKSNLRRYSPGLGGSDKCTKAKLNKPPDARTVVQSGKLQPSCDISASPHLSAPNTRSLVPKTRAMTCTRLLESKPCSSKIEEPSSIASSKRNSQVNALEVMENSISLAKHTQARDLEAKNQGDVTDLKQSALSEESQLQAAVSLDFAARKHRETFDGGPSDDHNDEKVASSFMLASEATLFNVAEQHDLVLNESFFEGNSQISLEEDHAEDLKGLISDIKLEIGPEKVLLEQGLTKLCLEPSTTKGELESGRSRLASKHTICNGCCEANLQAEREIVEFLGQENLFVHNSVEGSNITFNDSGVTKEAH
ncbi:putative GPI-anchored protein pfl2 isoform X2 [Nymphaea colorata]|uniref:putative GPI-anchored protein pfl2 isoform X2 n=1 Tax=Nymphaea colorata TaxID=210225 RepID=UPI00129EC1F2|nr:putative GPI-anchored protein pfl2 isoform X2 [Nymphaea colorata]